MSFDKSFRTNGAPAPAVPAQPTAAAGASFASSFVQGVKPPGPPTPSTVVPPIGTSFSSSFTQSAQTFAQAAAAPGQQVVAPSTSFSNSFAPGVQPSFPVAAQVVQPASTSFSSAFAQGPRPTIAQPATFQPVASSSASFATSFSPGLIPTGWINGATLTNPMSGNLTLTNASTQLQTVIPNANGLAIILPVATTISTLGLIFILKNVGTLAVQIQTSDGTLIGWVIGGQTMPIALESNGNAVGTWRLCSGDQNKDSGLNWSSNTLSFDPASGSSASPITCQLSANTGVIVYYEGTNVVCRAYRNTEGQTAWTASATNIIAAANFTGSGTQVDICQLSSTEAFIVYSAGSTVLVRTIDINASTLAITLNATAQADNQAGRAISCDKISSSVAFITWYNSITDVFASATVSVAAGTCTVNASGNITALGGRTIARCVVLSATLAHVVYDLFVVRVVLSGTLAPVPGTPVAITNGYSSGMGGYYSIAFVSATSSFTVVQNSTQLISYAINLADTGSTITVTQTQITDNPTTLGSSCRMDFAIGASGGASIVGWKPGVTGLSNLTLSVAHPNGTGAVMSGILPMPTFFNGNSLLVPPLIAKFFNGAGMIMLIMNAANIGGQQYRIIGQPVYLA